MTVEVRALRLRSLKWAVCLLRYTWAPFSIDVVGRWLVSFLQIGAAAFVAFAAAQAGQASGEESVLPRFLQPYFPEESASIPKAVTAALALIVVSGVLETFLAWTLTWTHVILNRRLTPTALEAALAINPAGSEDLDPSTAVQRWLLKQQLVEFLHNGIANVLGALGTIAIALVATFSISAGAGWVCVACLFLWSLAGAFLARKTLQASREAAYQHEVVGRVIRASAALRRDLSRPSLSRFWLARSQPKVESLGRGIQRQGIWGSLLFGVLGTIANAAPLLALLVVVAVGGLEASLAIYLYVSRLVPPLGNLAGLMPVLQDQFISIQRMYDVFAHRRGVALLEPEQDAPIKSFTLQRASISLNGSGSALTFPDMSVSHPETLCITGPSGSGKSTLLSALAGQRRLTTGTLLVNGAPVDPCSILWREKCSYLPQEPELLPGHMIDNLDRFPGWTLTPEINAVIERLAKSTSAGKESQVGVDWEGVSVGQRRIIALLRCLGSDAPVLLLDEPVAGVDQHFVDLIKSVMEHAIAQGKIIIMSMHEHDQARLKINNTKLVYLGLNPVAEEQDEGA